MTATRTPTFYWISPIAHGLRCRTRVNDWWLERKPSKGSGAVSSHDLVGVGVGLMAEVCHCEGGL